MQFRGRPAVCNMCCKVKTLWCTAGSSMLELCGAILRRAFPWSTHPVYTELSVGGGVPQARVHRGMPECNYTKLEPNMSCSLPTSWVTVAPSLVIVVHCGVGIRWEHIRQQTRLDARCSGDPISLVKGMHSLPNMTRGCTMQTAPFSCVGGRCCSRHPARPPLIQQICLL